MKMLSSLSWGDKDFDTTAFYPHCLPLDVAHADKVARRTWTFCAWIEDWEEKDLGPPDCSSQEQCILHKHRCLRIDPDCDKLYTVHADKVSFQKRQISNNYELFGILDGYNDEVLDDEQGKKWLIWFQNVAIDEITIDLLKESWST